MREIRAAAAVSLLVFAAACATSEAPPAVTPASAVSPRIASPARLDPAPALPPAPADPPPVPPAPDPGRANLDPDDDLNVGPPDALADCAERLTAAGVHFHAGKIPVVTQPSGMICGAPQIVIYEHGPSGIAWNAMPVVSCQLALGLARFEQMLAEEAERTLGQKVVRIYQGGTYACRKMARFKWVSEHAYANAIDLRGFELANHHVIWVKRDFGKLDAPPGTPESRFLRTLARRAFEEEVFSVVLTPFWDALHADHFHVDQARYRVGAVGP